MIWVETPESSNVLRFGYSEEDHILTVEFKKGGRYNYYDVPRNTFDQMRLAPSKGQFHARQIKGVYRYART